MLKIRLIDFYKLLLRLNQSRLIYLLFYAAVGSQLPFLPLFLSQQGFENEKVGLLMGLQGLAVLVAPGIASHIADSLKGGAKSVAILCNLLGALFLFLLTTTTDLYLSAILILSFGLFFVPLFSLVDGIVVSILRSHHEEAMNKFSSIRAFGTIGFMVPSAILAPSFYFFDLPYRFAIYLSASLALINAIYVFVFLKSDEVESKIHKSAPLVLGLKALRKPPLLLFTIINFLIATAMGTYYSFFSIRLKELGVPSHSIGLIYNLGPLFELPYLFLGGWLISRLGIKRLIMIAAVAGLFRFLILALSKSVFLVCVSMIAHSAIIMSLAILVTIILDRYCEPHYRYSVLGLTQILNGGVSRLIGGLTVGLALQLGISHQHEVTFAFILAAFLCLIALLLSFRLKLD